MKEGGPHKINNPLVSRERERERGGPLPYHSPIPLAGRAWHNHHHIHPPTHTYIHEHPLEEIRIRGSRNRRLYNSLESPTSCFFFLFFSLIPSPKKHASTLPFCLLLPPCTNSYCFLSTAAWFLLPNLPRS